MSHIPPKRASFPVHPVARAAGSARVASVLLRVGAVAVGCAAAGAGFYWAAGALTRDVVDLGRVSIAGHTVTTEAELERVIGEQGHAALSRRMTLGLPTELATSRNGNAHQPLADATFAELGFRVDVEKTKALALRSATRRSLLGTLTLGRITCVAPVEPCEARQEIPVQIAIDSEVLATRLATLKELSDTPPVSARLDLDRHEVVKERPGVYLDVFAAETTLQRLAEAPSSTDGTSGMMVLPVATFEPRVSSEFVKQLEIGTVIAEYETHFSRGGDQSRRGMNIDNAARRIDGLILAPNELVSFNAVVGDRSEANGFQRSWEIFKGEMVEGVGGGTCQVASTLHAASFFGGLDVLERLPHSRPSAYIPMGLDSTVVYPAVDLKLRNPHPFPVVVHTITGPNSLKIELLGREKPVQVAFGREVLGTIPFKRKVVEESSLSGKRVVHKQHGIRGYRIKRIRTLTYAGGQQRVEATTDFYPPTADIFQVPVGFDESKLPALPTAPGDEKEAQASKSAEGAECKGEGCVNSASSDSEIEIVEGRGAHAPTAQQATPSRSMRVAQ